MKKLKEPDLENLIQLLSRLPSIGPKSARRLALHLIKNKSNLMIPLHQAIIKVQENIIKCNICGNLKSKNDECICSNDSSDQICVVENIADMWAMESTSVFKGQYHILGGTLSALNGSNPEQLLINSLIERVKKQKIREVILAISATIEGQTTAHYIHDSLKSLNVKITKLAHGLPVGGEIEYLDDGTLFSAFKFRNSFNNKG
ncbi:MAG: recombination protein RecR [Candidatus Pelagibacter sp.]|nr:recombination protein RecR [Candidatus Pelagibacter sp.]OUV97060.1 MAG: recombination protein RecR [Candidatus Pelagibacter sp. TMED142]